MSTKFVSNEPIDINFDVVVDDNVDSKTSEKDSVGYVQPILDINDSSYQDRQVDINNQDFSDIKLKNVGYTPTINTTNNVTNCDLYNIFDNYNQIHGLEAQHIQSANNFYSNGISYIIKHGFIIEKEVIPNVNVTKNNEIVEKVKFNVSFTRVEVKNPEITTFNTGASEPLYPTEASLLEKNYSGSIYVDAVIKIDIYMKQPGTENTFITQKSYSINDFKICSIPIVVGSIKCNLYNKTKREWMLHNENPLFNGGYLQLKHSYSIDMIETMINNVPKIYKNLGHLNSKIQCEIISKPGDSYQNSYQLIINYNVDNTIWVKIEREKLNKVYIPFFLLFRAMGWVNDKNIFDHIVLDLNDKSNSEILAKLTVAMEADYKDDYKDTYDEIKACLAIAKLTNMYNNYDLSNPQNVTSVVHSIRKIFDKYCLSHVGTNTNDRQEKLKYIASYIRKILLVDSNMIEQTDRDSYANKRITAAGENYAKSFKTYFNHVVAIPLTTGLVNMYTNNLPENVNPTDVFKQKINSTKFDDIVTKTVTNAHKTEIQISNSQTIVNRLNSQLITLKNQLFLQSLLRQVISLNATDNAKQSVRSTELRLVHMAANGFICCAHSSPEGESVGIKKQLAIFSTLARSSSSVVLKNILKRDPELIAADHFCTPMFAYKNNYCKILVNGYLVGYVKDFKSFIQKYRFKRRMLDINCHTTIYWNCTENEIHFYVDMGRLIRPLAIVYNTERDAKELNLTEETKYVQGTAITKQDVIDIKVGKKTYIDLLVERKIEYVSPEEQQNCLLCPSYEKLEAAKHDHLNQYTHLDTPLAIFGLTALTSPFANHNQAPRLTYQTAQSKQTCGIYSINWPYVIGKELYLQYINENPLVCTTYSNYSINNGCNLIVAIMCYTGNNQEDSTIVSKGAIEKGLLDCSKFTYYMTQFTQKEERRVPSEVNTNSMKDFYNYKLLNNNAIVDIGTIVNNGDVLVGKVIVNPKGSEKQYSDDSLVYKDNEPAYVQNVIKGKNEENIEFIKVFLRKVRKLSAGDKQSSRSGQKGIVSLVMKDEDMPFLENGMRPDLLFNPHGIPSRMTVAQLMESLISNLCALKGTTYDGSSFNKVDIEGIKDELVKYGYNRHGTSKLYSGITGLPIDVEIFIGPTYYQRLQKFVKDASYSVKHTVKDPITRQAISGQASSGGVKIGEMERDVYSVHGSARIIAEKFRDHSDENHEYICSNCGNNAIVNIEIGRELYECKRCNENATFVRIENTWTAKMFRQEVSTLGVNMSLVVKPPEYSVEHVSNGNLYNAESIAKFLNKVNINEEDAEGASDDD